MSVGGKHWRKAQKNKNVGIFLVDEENTAVIID
jgi:hypothetical protein